MSFFSWLLFGSSRKYKAIQAADVAEAIRLASKKTIRGKFICENTTIAALAADKQYTMT
jgi:hypothetical protein